MCEGVSICTLPSYSHDDDSSDSGPDSDSNHANTDTSHWRQAAVVVPGGVPVKAGDVITVAACVEGSSVLLKIEGVGGNDAQSTREGLTPGQQQNKRKTHCSKAHLVQLSDGEH